MAKTGRTSTPEFKAETVKLVTERGRSFVEVAHGLDIGEGTPRSGRQAIAAGGRQAFPGRRNPPAPGEELRRLRPEVRWLRIERDILRIAMAFAGQSS
jgi:transposase